MRRWSEVGLQVSVINNCMNNDATMTRTARVAVSASVSIQEVARPSVGHRCVERSELEREVQAASVCHRACLERDTEEGKRQNPE